MSREDNKSPKDTISPLIKVGFFLSFLWILMAAMFPWVYHDLLGVLGWDLTSDGWRAPSLGETGDYLTGWLTPLALGWFVIAVFMQREELKEQRAEFRGSRQAAKRQADQLEKSNMVRREQAFFDLMKHSELARKQKATSITQLIQELAKPVSQRNYNVRNSPNTDTKTLEMVCGNTIGHIEAFSRDNSPYHRHDDSFEFKQLIVVLTETIGFYEMLASKAKEAKFDIFSLHLGGPLEQKFFNDCSHTLTKLKDQSAEAEQQKEAAA